MESEFSKTQSLVCVVDHRDSNSLRFGMAFVAANTVCADIVVADCAVHLLLWDRLLLLPFILFCFAFFYLAVRHCQIGTWVRLARTDNSPPQAARNVETTLDSANSPEKIKSNLTL
jgi:hypothetical protein